MVVASLVVVAVVLSGWIALRLWPDAAARAVLALGRRVAGMRRCELALAAAAGEPSRIVYLDGGDGEPLLLLHGLGADKDAFLQICAPLRARYRVIVPDLPGFGESDRPPAASYRTADQVARLHAFVAALGLTKLHIAGNSMGGLLAGAYAVAHPEQVASVWLLAPAGVKAAAPSELLAAIEAKRPLPIFAKDVAGVRAMLAFATYRPPYMPRFVLAYLANIQRASYDLNMKVVEHLLDGPWLDEQLVHRPTTPALIVWGDHDRAVDCSGAKILGDLLPRSKVIVLARCGHVPMLEVPKRVVADYLAFRATI